MKASVLFSQALAFAAEKHKKQTRRDKITPYIYHPIRVAELVRDAGYGVRYQVVALLHDVLEDTKTTDEEIMVFGEDIYEAVKLLTRPDGMDEEEYLRKILANPMAAIVKAADKIHNMQEASVCEDREWAQRYVAKSKKYYYGKFNQAVDDAIYKASVSTDEDSVNYDFQAAMILYK